MNLLNNGVQAMPGGGRLAISSQISEREEETLALMEEREGLATATAELEQERGAVAAEKDRISEVVSASWKEIDAGR